MKHDRRIFFIPGKRLFCLLFVALAMTGWTCLARGEAAGPAINASGNRNIRPAVDPIRKDEGYSAILYDNLNGLPTSEANAIAQTGDGFIWIGSYAGLIRYDGNAFTRIDTATGIANVRCLYVDSRDRLWIGTNDSGVFFISGEEIQSLNQVTDTGFASVRAITESASGTICIAMASGIGFYDDALNFTVLQDERIAGKTIRDIRTGCDGLIYALTLDGDLFTVRDRGVERFIGHDECRVKGIRTLLPDPEKPGFLYLGTEDSRICYGDITRNFAAKGVKDIAPLASVERFECIDGEIWVCAGNGVGRLDAEGFRRLKNVPMNNSMEHVLTDHEGNLWFTSSKQGVMKIVPNRFTDLFNQYDLTETVVNSTCIDDNRLFIGTDEGLIVVEKGKRVDAIPLTRAATASGRAVDADDLLQYLDGVRIRSILRDSAGRLWICTWRSPGLICYDRGEATVFTVEDGLYSDRVRTVAEQEDGSILVAYTGGVSVIRDGHVTEGYGEKDGIAVTEILTVTEGFRHDIILGSDGGGIYVITSEGVRHIGMGDGLRSEVIMRVVRSRYRDIYWIVTGNSLATMTPDYQVTTIEHFPYSNNYDLYENARGDVWVLSSNGIYVASAEALLANAQIDATFYGIPGGLPYIPTSNAFSALTPDGDLYIAGRKGAVRVNIEKPFESTGELRIAMPYIEIDGKRVYPNASGYFTVPYYAKKLTLYPYVIGFSLMDPRVSYRLEGFDTEDTAFSRSALTPVSYTNLREGAYSFVIRANDPNGGDDVSASFDIVKETTVYYGMVGTVIIDAISLVFMIGILIYTALYRQRGRLDDALYFAMLVSNMVLTVSEMTSYLAEGSALPYIRVLMIAANTVFYAAFALFPYLLLLYLDYRVYQDKARLKRKKLLFGIPCFLLLIVLVINLKTGWIFKIGEDNTFRSGTIDQIVFVPMALYLLHSAVKAYKINYRMVLLGVVILAARVTWEIWFQGISSTSFVNALFLACIHISVMNKPLYEERA